MTNLTQLPVIGPWTRRVGAVARMMATPCSPTAQVWVEAFFAAEAKLVWSLFKPDPTDVSFHRGGGRHGHGKNFLFDFAIAIEEELFVGKSAFRAALFTIGELATEVGWWFLIIDAGTEFAVNWMSLAYEWSGCKGGRYCELNGAWLLIDGEVNNPHPTWQYQAGDNALNAVDGIIVPADGTFGVGLSVTVSPWPLAPIPLGSVTAVLLNTITNQPEFTIPPPTVDPVTKTGTRSAMTIIKNNSGSPKKFVPLWSCHGGYALIDGSKLTCTDQSTSFYSADP